MENKAALYSSRELTEIIRSCRSLPEMQSAISFIAPELDRFPVSDQGFLLAMMGITIMTLTEEPAMCEQNIVNIRELLISRNSWSRMKGSTPV